MMPMAPRVARAYTDAEACQPARDDTAPEGKTRYGLQKYTKHYVRKDERKRRRKLQRAARKAQRAK